MDFSRSMRMVREAAQAGVFPSAVAAVGRYDRVCAQAAFGLRSLPERAPADLGTRYDLASMTKALSTATAALRLCEEGGLRLDHRMADFFPDAPQDKRDITVRALLTHTAGFPAHFHLRDRDGDPSRAARTILSEPLSLRPGSDVLYSCMGYILLGKLLEKAAGMPLDTLAEKLVFGPLGMRHTGYNPSGDDIAATEYRAEYGRCLCGTVHDENARFLYGVSGNAGLFSDLGDCVRYASMLACGGAERSGAFLRAETWREAVRNHTPGCSENRGLGFQLAGTEGCFAGGRFSRASFGHTGFTGTSFLVEPETGLFAVLLTNRVHPSRQNKAIIGFRRRFHDCVKEEFLGSA